MNPTNICWAPTRCHAPVLGSGQKTSSLSGDTRRMEWGIEWQASCARHGGDTWLLCLAGLSWSLTAGAQSTRGGLKEGQPAKCVLPDQEGPCGAVMASKQERDRQACSFVISQFPLSFPTGVPCLCGAGLRSLRNQDAHLFGVACYNVAPLVYTHWTWLGLYTSLCSTCWNFPILS